MFNFVRVSENICTICLQNFHKEYGKCVTTVPLFAETFNKEGSNVLCEKPIILVELLLKLRIVVIQFLFEASDLATEVTPKQAADLCK